MAIVTVLSANSPQIIRQVTARATVKLPKQQPQKHHKRTTLAARRVMSDIFGVVIIKSFYD